MKLIQKAKVPVIPIYFHAKNSTFFYRLASVSDVLRTAKLPSEMLSQKKTEDQGANWKSDFAQGHAGDRYYRSFNGFFTSKDLHACQCL